MARNSFKSINRRKRLRGRDVRKGKMITRRMRENACDICRKILRLFTMPQALRGDRQYHLEFGSPTQVLDSKCEKHSRLISRCLNIDLRCFQFDTISIRGYVNRDYIQIFAEKGNNHIFRESGELKLLPTIRFQPGAWGRFVDAKWIDYSLPRKWKLRCDKEHACTSPESLGHLKGKLPLWVVDTWQHCLVPCSPSTAYVALSYVWGGTPMFMALKENIKSLQNLSSLAEDSTKRIPRTIRDAVSFVQRLGERYLWVDSLCIVQDDAQKLAEIADMGAIYANATITIVASDGDNADKGLHGLRGMSGSRSVRQFVHSLGRGAPLIETYGPSVAWTPSTWYTRGWTLQEALFSRRRVAFQKDWVRWECHGATWDEYSDAGEPVPRVFGKVVPNMAELSSIIRAFNTRNLTFPEDALFAFSGIASALSSTFRQGFISGIPALSFHLGLLWKPTSTVSRRIPKRPSGDSCLPPWSWAGWKGDLVCLDIQTADSIKKCSARARGIFRERVSPLVEWSWMEKLDGTKSLIQDSWYEHKKTYWNKLVASCPPGWTRHHVKDPSLVPSWQRANQPQRVAVPLCFYKHESEPDSEFWYPLPLPHGTELIKAHILAPYITCRTQRARLVSGEKFVSFRKQMQTISIRDREGKWAGALVLCEPLGSGEGEDSAEAGKLLPRGITLELVEIARGSVPNDVRDFGEIGLEELVLNERPNSGVYYEYYYVLWIEWKAGVAYRKAIGRVHKDAWESQEREWIDLVLG
ncbi:HET-domain-containing protein [Xylariaceae sp. FL1651]|nr:HET-domain-containing protein [Xylariaceae sp. FL1651]